MNVNGDTKINELPVYVRRMIGNALTTKSLIYSRCAASTPNERLKKIYKEDQQLAIDLGQVFLSE